eukprot:794545-Rhodomonas_salina.1
MVLRVEHYRSTEFVPASLRGYAPGTDRVVWFYALSELAKCYRATLRKGNACYGATRRVIGGYLGRSVLGPAVPLACEETYAISVPH